MKNYCYDLTKYNLIERKRVGKIGNTDVHMYSNEEGVPHFHAMSNDRETINAKFSLDGEYLIGKIDGKNRRVIKEYCQNNANKLKDIYNSLRPTDDKRLAR